MSITEVSVRKRTAKEQLAYDMGYQMGKHDAVRHGRWEPHPSVYSYVRCSVCHDCNILEDWVDGKKWRYCPNCGATMDAKK